MYLKQCNAHIQRLKTLGSYTQRNSQQKKTLCRTMIARIWNIGNGCYCKYWTAIYWTAPTTSQLPCSALLGIGLDWVVFYVRDGLYRLKDWI